MSRVPGIVMRKELTEALRDRRTLLTSLVLGPVFAPLFFILILKLALARSVESQDELVPVTVANAAAAPNLVQQLRESGLAVRLRDGSDGDIRRWIADQDGLVVLRVPQNFAVRFERDADALGAPEVDHIARVLLRRYGVVFRKLLERESGLPPWRELFYVYRRMEARGEIRGGRFVSGFAGEQFAHPEGVDLLRSVPPDSIVDRISISAADPLNLVGIVTPGEKVPALSGNRALFDQGIPTAVQAGGEVLFLRPVAENAKWHIRNLLIQREVPGTFLPESTFSH